MFPDKRREKPQVFWFWWNAIGCVVTLAVGYGVSALLSCKLVIEKVSDERWEGALRTVPQPEQKLKGLIWRPGEMKKDEKINWVPIYALMGLYFIGMIIFCYALPKILS